MNPQELRHLIGRKVKEYREGKGIERAELAEMLNMSKENLGNIERGEQLPTLVQLLQLVSITGLPADSWLSNSDIKNILLEPPSPVYERKQDLEVFNTTDKVVMYVPLVNEYAYGSYLRGYGQPVFVDSLPKKPWIVDREYKGNYMSFEVRGDSMDDGSRNSLIPGDILLTREINRDLWIKSKLHINKYRFVIAHRTDGIIVKQIIKHDVERGILTLHSLNYQAYPDYDISVDDVFKIFNIVRVERKE